MAARKTTPSATPTPDPTPQPVATAPAPVQPAPSVLGRLRGNRMGAVLGGLIVALVLGALLSVLVPDSQLLLALILLGLGEAAAVGFTVRYLSECRGLKTQLTAFVLTGIGVHVLATTGMINQQIGSIGDFAGVLGGGIGSGLGWDDALMGALATPSVSTGAVVCGLIAAIIAGWGPRGEGHSSVRDASV
jgi:MFS family permease